MEAFALVMSPKCQFQKNGLITNRNPDPGRRRQPRPADGDNGRVLLGPVGLAEIEAQLGRELESDVSHAPRGTRGEHRPTPRPRHTLSDDALRGMAIEPRDPDAGTEVQSNRYVWPTAVNAEKRGTRSQRAADAAEASRRASARHLTVGAELPWRPEIMAKAEPPAPRRDPVRREEGAVDGGGHHSEGCAVRRHRRGRNRRRHDGRRGRP